MKKLVSVFIIELRFPSVVKCLVWKWQIQWKSRWKDASNLIEHADKNREINLLEESLLLTKVYFWQSDKMFHGLSLRDKFRIKLKLTWLPAGEIRVTLIGKKKWKIFLIVGNFLTNQSPVYKSRDHVWNNQMPVSLLCSVCGSFSSNKSKYHPEPNRFHPHPTNKPTNWPNWDEGWHWH